LKSIDVKILCRIYAKFRKRDIWFHDLPKTTVNTEIRYIIPIDRENGIIMISYSDSKYARFWGSLDKRRLISTLQHKLESALSRPIPRPKEVQAFYWNTGTAFWKPGVDSRTLASRILQPDQQVSFYICGENYSENQGWIEGALESSNQVIQSLQNI
jgi:monoamine oxidase